MSVLTLVRQRLGSLQKVLLSNEISSQMTEQKWFSFLQPNDHNINENYAIVVLNRPIKLDPKLTISLWNNALVRAVVDGGANRWLTFQDNFCSNIDMKGPDLVTGDFDSITQDTKYRIEKTAARFVHTNDQNESDFTKALLELKKNYIDQEKIGSVIVLLDISGRIDHILSHINTLFKSHIFMPNIRVYILGKTSVSWLLAAGKHVINIPRAFVDKQLWCSYVPIGQKCIVTTTGLKWDLDNHPVEFGGIISTSNTYASDVVTFETDGFLYWSMGLEATED